MKQPTTVDSGKCNGDVWTYEHATVEPPRPDDPKILGPNLRQADKDEIFACAGVDGEYALKMSVDTSNYCMSVRDRETEEPLGLFGVCPFVDDRLGIVWFLGSDELFKKNRMAFLRNSEFWVKNLFGSYEILFNLVDARNTIHIRWLKWLRFTFIADVPEYGYEKRTFRQFLRHKDD